MKWNLDDPPRYGGLAIDGIPPFQAAIEFEFDPAVNVFIGPNATGKSTILKLLSPEFQEFGNLPGKGYSIERAGDNWLDPYIGDDGRMVGPGAPPQTGQTRVNRGAVPVVYLPPVREVAPPYPDEFAADDSYPEHRYGKFYADKSNKIIEDQIGGLPNYDAETSVAKESWFRYIRQEGEMPLKRNVPVEDMWLDAYPYTRFDCNRVYYALQKLAAEDESRAGSGRDAAAVAEATRACLRDICPEVIQGDLASHPIAVLLDPDADESDPFYGYTTVRGNFGMAAHIAGADKAVYVGDLSTGTQGLFWWICYLALKMACHYSFSDGINAGDRSYRWQDQPAILLIDEIENHLHPTWQRRVIPALRKHFPKLQIFATTHSPFVVAGLKRGQVHRLYREKGVIKTDQLTEEEKEHKLVGWTVEEILREFMDVTDPTDEATATAAATLRWLRGRYPSNGEVTAVQWVQECIQQLQDNPERTRDEEYAWHWLKAKQSGIAADDATPGLEWRDAALDELRDIVSPDLEAGGPLAAQQELFIAQLRDLLADDEIDSHDPDGEV